MPYRRIQFVKNSFYHIFSRGDRKEDIFFSDKDKNRFLEKAEEYRIKYGIDILCFCLMSNHIHFLVQQITNLPLSKFVGVLLNSQARYATIKYNLPNGHFSQGPFGAKLIDTEGDLLQVSRYIHLNPIKAKILKMDFTLKTSRVLYKNPQLVQSLRNFPWSSYSSYIYGKSSVLITLKKEIILGLEGSKNNYRKFVESKISDENMLELESF